MAGSLSPPERSRSHPICAGTGTRLRSPLGPRHTSSLKSEASTPLKFGASGYRLEIEGLIGAMIGESGGLADGLRELTGLEAHQRSKLSA